MNRFLKITSTIAATLYASLHSGLLPAQTDLETRQVTLSRNLKVGDRTGHLHFLGMLELPDITHDGVRLSQLSGLAWDDDEGILYTLSDKGGLFHLQPQFRDGKLTGAKLLRSLTLREPGTDKPLRGWRIDAEGLDIVNGRNGRKGDAELIVSMERVPQITRYRPDGYAIARLTPPAPINDAGAFRSPNKLLEAVCRDSAHGVLTMPEVPLTNERQGYNRIFSLDGPSWYYPVAPGDRITAMECLGDGAVMVLHQNYQNPLGRIVTTLKRVRLTSGSSNQNLTPETIVALDNEQGFQIDNFEGLTRHKGNRYFMVSDNNDIFIQRSLLMYFELLDE